MTDGAARSNLPSAPGSAPGLLRGLADARFLGWAALATGGSLLAFGLVSAIIPNPVFGRSIPPEPFAIAVWLLSAPLMGVLLATYLVPPPAVPVTLGAGQAASSAASGGAPPRGSGATSGGRGAVSAGGDPSAGGDAAGERRSLLGYAGGIAAFLAIGCPVCNKIVLVALGTSGALTIWAPLQPLLGAASIVLLAGALVWRLRIRARGGACSVA